MLKDCKDSFSSGKQLGMILTSAFNLIGTLSLKSFRYSAIKEGGHVFSIDLNFYMAPSKIQITLASEKDKSPHIPGDNWICGMVGAPSAKISSSNHPCSTNRVPLRQTDCN